MYIQSSRPLLDSQPAPSTFKKFLQQIFLQFFFLFLQLESTQPTNQHIGFLMNGIVCSF